MSSYLSAPTNTEVKSSQRQRGHSAMNFKTASTGVASAAMRNELNRMVADVKDPSQRKVFEAEMHSFFHLFTRYLSTKATNAKIEWDKIKPPSPDRVIDYKTLASPKEANLKGYLDKLAVLKLNGGLGTTMGLAGTPKSAIEVREGMTFLDLSVRQIEHLNEQYKVNVPFILMNSFNTDDETQRIIQKYANHNIQIVTFNQSRFPRVGRESNLPIPRSATSDKSQWYPPGHGDIFDALKNSGLLDKLIAAGKEYIFVSNADNLGADVDPRILKLFAEGREVDKLDKNGNVVEDPVTKQPAKEVKPIDYLMELTDKTRADVKGGTIIGYGDNDKLRLLEVAQVPSEHVEDFKSVTKFKIFNTNNLWMNLKSIREWMNQESLKADSAGKKGEEGEEGDDNLDIIVNPKVADDGTPIIQLETAVGAAIRHFPGACGINVPRSRFLPVKSCSDLLLITSDLYSLEHGKLVMNPNRQFGQTPVIKLGDNFKKIANFQKRFRTIPNILELDHLTVAGDVHFGRKVTLRGTVIIVANEGSRIDLPDGSILENKLVSGNVSIIDH